MSWDESRRKSRKLERELENKVEELRSFNANFTLDAVSYDQESASYPEETKLISAIDSLFIELGKSIDSMEEFATDRSKAQQVHRFRQIVQENAKDYKRIARSLREKRTSAELFGNAMSKTRDNSDTEHLLRERKGLESGLRTADMLLDQADKTKAELESQRNTFQATGQRLLSGVINTFPVLGSWIEKVKRRKQREQIILASVIAGLFLFLLWYLFKR